VENKLIGEAPVKKEELFNQLHSELLEQAAGVFTGDLNTYIENVRRAHEQTIDIANLDTLIHVGWDEANTENASAMVKDFKEWIQLHKDEIIALQIFYSQPHRRRELTLKMIKDVIQVLKTEKPSLA